MPWNQHNKMVLEEQCLLWSFFNFCAPAFSRSTNCFTRVMGLKLMDCFCSLVAVVIFSLPWNSITRETETFAAVWTFWYCIWWRSSPSLEQARRTCHISKQTAPLPFSQIIWGLGSISKSGRNHSLLSHGDVVGHDNDRNKSFGRMADEVDRVTRWGRKSDGKGAALTGLVCAQWGVALSRGCGLRARMPAVWCLEDCEESCLDFKLIDKTFLP